MKLIFYNYFFKAMFKIHTSTCTHTHTHTHKPFQNNEAMNINSNFYLIYLYFFNYSRC